MKNIRENVSCLLLMACGALIFISSFLPWINYLSYVGPDFPFTSATGWGLVDFARATAGNPFGLNLQGSLGTGLLSVIAGAAIILCSVLFLKYRRGMWKAILLALVAFSVAISFTNARTIRHLGVPTGGPVGYGLNLFIYASCAGLIVWLALASSDLLRTGERTRRSLTRQVGWRMAGGASLAVVGGALIVASVFLPWTVTRSKPSLPTTSHLKPREFVEEITGWDTVEIMGQDLYSVSYYVNGEKGLQYVEDESQTVHGNPFYIWEDEVAMFSGATVLIAAAIFLLLALALLFLRREWLAWAVVLASIYLLALVFIDVFSCVKMVWWSGRGGIPDSNLAGLFAPSYPEGIRVSVGSGMWLMFAASLFCPFGGMLAAWGLTRLAPAEREAVQPVFGPSLRLKNDISR